MATEAGKFPWEKVSVFLSGVVVSGVIQWGTFVLFISRDVPSREEVSRKIQDESYWPHDKPYYDEKLESLERIADKLTSSVTSIDKVLTRVDANVVQLASEFQKAQKQ